VQSKRAGITHSLKRSEVRAPSPLLRTPPPWSKTQSRPAFGTTVTNWLSNSKLIERNSIVRNIPLLGMFTILVIGMNFN